MKNKKKNIYHIIICFCFALLVSLLIEFVFFNFHAIRYKQYNNKELKIINTKNIKESQEYYKTTSDDAMIILQGDNSYVHKIQIDYEYEADFSWDIISTDQDGGQKIRTHHNAAILNKTVRKVGNCSKKIEINFHNKDMKIKKITVSNLLNINFYRIIVMTFTLFLLVILYRYRKYWFSNLHKTFLLVSFVTGVLIILVTPVSMYTSWDDQVHFSRSYTLLDGKESKWSYAGRYFNHLLIGSQDRFRSEEDIKEYKKFLNRNNTKESIIKVHNDDHSIDYNEFVYLPFAFGLKIGRLFSTNFTTMIYLAKILNLLLYISIFYFAIKIAPYGKRILFIISLFPINIYLASQFSYDSTITAGLMLGIASFLKLMTLDKVDNKYLLIFIFSTLWASFPKAVYSPLLLLLLLIPKDKFKNKKNSTMIKTGVIILFLVMMSSFVLPVLLGQATAGDARIEGSSVSGQFKYILSNPFNYAKILLMATLKYSRSMFFGYDAMSRMGYLTSDSMWWFDLSNFVTLFLLLYTTFTSKIDKKVMNNILKISFITLLIIIWCLVWTSLYLSWNPVGSSAITGVQSRYFIPVLFPLLLIFVPISKKEKKSEKPTFNQILLLMIPLLILMYNIFFIIIKFYK